MIQEIQCPKCGSMRITGNKKGFGLGKAAIGGALIGPVGLLGGFVGSGKIIVTCLNCGMQWDPKRIQKQSVNKNYSGKIECFIGSILGFIICIIIFNYGLEFNIVGSVILSIFVMFVCSIIGLVIGISSKVNKKYIQEDTTYISIPLVDLEYFGACPYCGRLKGAKNIIKCQKCDD